ncbi:uncharacterized protein NECHADRAFT_84115 [Fusarium vanettenii 77-13-4]|uniref:Uncharacterized protein n=1 Tax=Fusarium vanettenii (strain ATCC MYA-4622 / CBS 123669 / FGSC 9596 / NRRL 45880 / 77-13-4) TaxID=660122 RepID=C7YZR1_FUSV7|nr:uncharacterized protein NECHADRAFT_84115 [Fusarium vanettenii 77-13-4]EEU42652.1 predicted protein [Fusarium vanettenii 77-13-4]
MTIPSSVKLRYTSSQREIQLPDRLSHSQGLLHHRYAPHAAAWLDVGVHRLEVGEASRASPGGKQSGSNSTSVEMQTICCPKLIPGLSGIKRIAAQARGGCASATGGPQWDDPLLEAANKPRNLVETQSGPLVSSGSRHLAMPMQERQKPNSGYICLHRVALRPSTHTGFMNAGGDAMEKRVLPLLENLV